MPHLDVPHHADKPAAAGPCHDLSVVGIAGEEVFAAVIRYMLVTGVGIIHRYYGLAPGLELD